MKKGYWIVAYRSVSDHKTLAAYSQLAGPAILANGGKILVRAAEVSEHHEAGLNQRIVVSEFESLQQALAAYHSEPYQQALKVLGTAAERDFRIVEGV